MTDRIVLLTGATGRQGGETARALAGKGFKLRAMTRKPGSDAANALAALGIEVVQGDLNDEASLQRALADVWGAYAVQNTWEAGVEQEEVQGKRFAQLARDAGVHHFVYASVASAHLGTGIPHFENKFRVEQTVKSLGFPSYAIIRPVFFMENLPTPWFLNGDKLVSTLSPTTTLQMIATRDIGQYGAMAFLDQARFHNLELDIAGDEVTLPQAADTLGRALGTPITYLQIPIEEVRKNSNDFALMLEWFERGGYSVDIPGNASRFGIKPTTLESWAQTLRK
ncbi:MAG TPA: NmrA/HSCARG family protein [Vicinamibacterales bacterium]|nr:NmrA/HSCARG family protein [Vicinamibacterales bacterium]